MSPRQACLWWHVAAVALAAVGSAPAGDAPTLRVRTDFPGGSARVVQLDQDKRLLRLLPGGRADLGWVCWWFCKVEGLRPGEILTLEVGGGVWATPDRAAYCTDGVNWRHTEPGQRHKEGITYRQPVGAGTAWFAWGPPYVLKHANDLARRAADASPHVSAFELCKSRGGRPVPALRIAETVGGKPPARGVWVQARQHAWECGSSWVAEGLVEWLVSGDPAAGRLRRTATVTVVPVMDADNVELGQGGKAQKPHDHNRDWSDAPVWPEVKAAMNHIQADDAAGRFELFVDLHNPAAGDRQPFFFVPAPDLLSPAGRRNQAAFLDAARANITGPLKLAPTARESGPGYDPNWRRISGNWVAQNSRPHVVSVCLETSWNTPHSTAGNYKTVGRQLGLAIERYLSGVARRDDSPGLRE